MEKKFFFDTKSEVVLAHGVELNEEEKFTRRKTLKQVLTSYVKDEFDLAHFSRQKTELSCASAVMDVIGGWIEGGRIN